MLQMLLTFECYKMLKNHSIVRRARDLHAVIISAFAMTVPGIVDITLIRHPNTPLNVFKTPYGVASISQLAAIFALMIFLLSTPRQPEVFYNGQLVDHQKGASFFSNMTYSWTRPWHKGSDALTLSDIPAVPHSKRARTMSDRFQATAPNQRVWLRLIRVQSATVAKQLLLIASKAAVSCSAQMFLHRTLLSLETVPHSRSNVYFWTAGLALSLVLEVVTDTWIAWINEVGLQMPTIVIIRNLVFQKATRRLIVHYTNEKGVNSSGGESGAEHQSEINLVLGDW
jgi:hypothetical protein